MKFYFVTGQSSVVCPPNWTATRDSPLSVGAHHTPVLSENSECGLVGYDTVSTCGWALVLQRNLLTPSSALKMEAVGFSKCL
jgi:hypothetical protein